MTLNIVLLTFIMVVFLAYTLGIYFAFGVTTSISSSIHKLQGTKKSLYSLFMLGIAIPFMIVSDTPLGWWAGAFLAIDFAAPSGGNKFQYILHCIGADVGMLLGMVMLIVDFGQWPIVAVTAVYVAFYQFRKIENRTWWIECTVFAAAWIGLLIEKVL
jgi:hypothetical protein